MSKAEAYVLLIGPRPTVVPEFLGGGSKKLEVVALFRGPREVGDLGDQAWGPCGRLPSPPLSTYQTLFLVSGMGLEDLSGVQRGNTQLGAGCDKGPECRGQVLAPGYRGTEGRAPTLTTMTTQAGGECVVRAPAGKESSRMFQEPGHRLQTLGPGGARHQVPFKSWGRGGVWVAAWAWGPGPCQFCCEGCMPCRGLSEQQAKPVLFLPLCLFQSAEGNLGGLPEDVFHILPKLGRTFQVEGGPDLLTGALALCVGDGLQLGCPELAQLLLVLPQVCLAANEHHGDPPTEMCDLREPLDENVVVASGVHDVIADEHEMGVLVGQGPKPVVIFLPGGVVEVQGHLLAAHGHAGCVLLEHGWGVVLGERALAVHHEQRSLAAAAVAYDHNLQLLPAGARGGGCGRGRGPSSVHSQEPAALAAAPGVERRG